MRRFVTAVSVTALLGWTPLAAQQLPSPQFSWTGWRVGVSGGVQLGESHTAFGYPGSNWSNGSYAPSLTSGFPMAEMISAGTINFAHTGRWPSTLNRFDARGYVGGQIGYDRQFGNGVIVGVEGGFYRLHQTSASSWSDKGSVTGMVFPGLNGTDSWTQSMDVHTKLSSLAMLKARLGYAFDRFAFFLTGGPAVGRARTAAAASSMHSATLTDPGCQGCHASTTSTWSGSGQRWTPGFNLGASAEVALTDHWVAKVDYSYYELSKVKAYAAGLASTDSGQSQAAPAIGVSTKNSGHLVQFGIDYRF